MTSKDENESPNEYETPPTENYEVVYIKVGVLTEFFREEHGPQRDHPDWKPGDKWKDDLKRRGEAYGTYDPLLFPPRIVSRRKDGVLWTLDGNGSNHWVEEKFGPEFEVESRV